MFEQKEAIVLEKPTVARNAPARCATCGAKNVMCTSGPLPRHVDRGECEAQMSSNRIARIRGGK
jgi:hypothetical protein